MDKLPYKETAAFAVTLTILYINQQYSGGFAPTLLMGCMIYGSVLRVMQTAKRRKLK